MYVVAVSSEKIIAPMKIFLHSAPLYIPTIGVTAITPMAPANNAIKTASNVRNPPNTRLSSLL